MIKEKPALHNTTKKGEQSSFLPRVRAAKQSAPRNLIFAYKFRAYRVLKIQNIPRLVPHSLRVFVWRNYFKALFSGMRGEAFSA